MPIIGLKKQDKENVDLPVYDIIEGEIPLEAGLTSVESNLISIRDESKKDTDSTTLKGNLFPFDDANTS